MMREFALLLLQIALYSTVTATVLFLLKRILRFRIPPLLNTLLWASLLIRLCFPYLPESSVSIYNFLPGSRVVFTGEILDGEYFGTRPSTVSEAEYIESTLALSHGDTPEILPESEPYVAKQENNLPAVIVHVYLLGVILCLGGFAVSYFTALRRIFRHAIPCDDKATLQMYREAAQKLHIPDEDLPRLLCASASMLVGIHKPMLLLATDADEEDIPLILIHELNHYIHRDNFWIHFWNVICCIFWFCPMIWIVARDVRDEIEILCDARTLRFPSVSQVRYASLLYRTADVSVARRICATQMSAEGKRLKQRLRRIAYRRERQPWFLRLGTVLLCTAAVSICLTNPVSSLLWDYDVYIETGEMLTGDRYSDIASSDNISGVRFYHIIYTTLVNRTGGVASQIPKVLGDGSLKALTTAALRADIAFWGYEDYMADIASAESLTHAQAAVILDSVIRLLSTATNKQELDILPQQIRESTLANVMFNLSPTDARAVLSAYNRGSQDMECEYSNIYTVETMVRILSRIENDWLRQKFSAYYFRQSLDAVSEEIQNTLPITEYDYVYVLMQKINPKEEQALKDIVTITRAGVREDVFYLKPREDLYTVEYIRSLYHAAGFDLEKLHEEYAALGFSDCDFENRGVYWRVYRSLPRIRNTSGIAAVDTIVRNLYTTGVIQLQNGSFPYAEPLTFGESMQMLCLLYAGMTSNP